MSDTLAKARAYEAVHGPQIPGDQRPGFHLSPYVGWMNDPNGFSFYGGMYHLFYQYNPYDTVWGPMHWGHAVSRDLLHWEYRPAALAPDAWYDHAGCFSGSAQELPDGRHLLMYTGVRRREDGACLQTQCLAVGDGNTYEKYAGNPVLDESALPPGANPCDFRDPKLWREADGSFRCVVGTCLADGSGCILRFRSPDGFCWKEDGVLEPNVHRYGKMWECPDYFPLGDKQVLLVSVVGAQDIPAEEGALPPGNHVLCLTGHQAPDGSLCVQSMHPMDCGLDFYAPQTLLAPDGRRILVAWMHSWHFLEERSEQPLPWMGQHTVPRELSLRDGRVIQAPIRELESLRGPVQFRGRLTIRGEQVLEQVRGRMLDLTVDLVPLEGAPQYEAVFLDLALDGEYRTTVSYHPASSLLRLDRSRSGAAPDQVLERSCTIPRRSGAVKLRAILDRFSLELFVNDGEQVLSCVLYTPAAADGVGIRVQGALTARIESYPLLP